MIIDYINKTFENAEPIFLSVVSIADALGPPKVLYVTIVTTSAIPTGLLQTPPATNPAVCAISAINIVSLEFSLIKFLIFCQSISNGNDDVPTTIIFGLCFFNNALISS